MNESTDAPHLPLEGPRFLSRRFATAKEILGEGPWADLLAEFTEAMENELDLFLNAILTLPDRPPLHEAQAHIILGELVAHVFYEA